MRVRPSGGTYMHVYISRDCLRLGRRGKDGKRERGKAYVVIQLAEYQHEFPLDVFRARERVVGFVEAERVRVQVGGEVADCGGDAGVEGAAVGEVAA